MRRHLLLSVAAYAAAFVPAALAWIQMAGGAIPVGAPTVSPQDGRLHAWILAWVTHALVTPASLFEANINYPAPMQLAGSEHFLSTQILFAPVFLLTGNAVLATNVVVLVSYLLAGLAMQQLLMALGCRLLPAWIAGLVYALGPLRAIGNFQLLQYLNFYLPWTALALHRLRQQPTLGRAAVVALVIGLASFSSYYMAVLVLFLAALWGTLELLHAGAARMRFMLLTAAAVVSAVGPLLLYSAPYRARAGHVGSVAALLAKPVEHLTLTGPFDFASAFNPIELVLAGLGVLLVASRTDPVGRLSRAGLLIGVVGAAFMLGPLRLSVGGLPVWFPYYVIATSPLVFFRCWWRFSVLAAFGTALLTAATLEWLNRREHFRPAVVVAAIVLLVSRVPLLGGIGLDEMVGQTRPIYAEVARAIRREGMGGALLELPAVNADGQRTEMEATLASTRHWLPLVNGHTGYPPPHRQLVDRSIARLPASEALDELVTLTHLRWILLQPEKDWPRPDVRAGIRELPEVERALWYDGWELLRVNRTSPDDRWFHAIAAGWRDGHTLLGTPIAPLAREAADAALMKTKEMPTRITPGRRTMVDVTVANRGSADWPVTVPGWLPETHRVQLRIWWGRVKNGVTMEEALSETAPLPRDVAAGEAIRVQVPLLPPHRRGAYQLIISVEQIGSDSFAPPNGGRLEEMILVGPAPKLQKTPRSRPAAPE